MGTVRDFKMPDLGEGLESGEIVRWNVDVGDHVDLNQEICEVETAKAVVAVPCPFAGTVVERFGDVGEELEVGEPLVRIDVEEVADPSALPDEVADQVEAGGAQEVAGSEAGPEASAEDASSERGKRTNVLVGYGAAEGTATRRRRRGGGTSGPAPAGGNGQRTAGTKPLAKPPVRKLAKDLGVDLAAIAPGSGEGGIVTRDDVRAAAEGATVAPDRGAPSRREVVEVGGGFRGRQPGDVIPITGIKKRIVEKMVRSRTEIPEASTGLTVDVTELWDASRRLTEQAAAEARVDGRGGDPVRISAFALVARATVIALRRFPTLNARLDDGAGEIRLLEPINLGVAVDTERGLMVPVIRDAHTRSTLDLAAELNRLAIAARDGTVTPGELTGGTFTVNNYGALGDDFGDPIINHPEAGILGVGAMRERPWVVDGELAVRRTCTLTVAFDHRISDGGEAGRFVAYVGELIEDPTRILLHA